MSSNEKIFLIRVGKGVESISRVFDKPTVVLGRSPDVDFMIPDLGVSRTHIEIIMKHNQIWVVDLGSANGTFLNGVPLEKNKKQVCTSGDFIELGSNKVPIWIEVVEKGFDFNDIKAAKIGNEDKQKLMNIVQSAYAEAKRVQDQTVDLIAKHKKNVEDKMQSMILDANRKAEEIISLANSDAVLIKEEARKKHSEIVMKAQQDADSSVQSIYDKAHQTLKNAEDDANQKLKKINEQIHTLREKADDEIAEALNSARTQADHIRKKAEELASIQKDQLASEFEKEKLAWQAEAEQKFIKKVEEKEKELESKRVGIIKQIEEDLRKKHEQAELISKVKLQAAENEALKKREQAEGYLQQAKEEFENYTKSERTKIKEEAERILENAKLEGRQLIDNTKAEAQREIDSANNFIKSLQKKIDEEKNKFTEVSQKFLKAKEETDLTISKYEDALLKYKEAEEKLKNKLNSVQELEARDHELKKESVSLQEKISKYEEQIRDSEKELQNFQNQKKNIVVELDQLRSRMHNEKEKAEAEIKHLKDDAKNEIELYRQRENEIINKFKLDELQTIKNLQEELKNKLALERSRFAQLVGQHVEDHLIISLKSFMKDNANTSDFLTKIKLDIQETLEEEIFKATDGAAQVVKPELIQKQQIKYKNVRNAGLALMSILVALFYLSPKFHSFVVETFKKNSVEHASQKFSNDLEKERNRRYQPEQSEEWHESYTDSVLFSKNYTDLKLNNEKQEKWIKDLHNYLFTQLRVNEDDIVKLVSKEAALITELNEIKANTHPDFVKENIKKMHDLENETVAEMKKIIGSEEKYKNFLRYSKNYYLNEMNLNRLPANK